jgi:apolipoprotein N-acyltransferase
MAILVAEPPATALPTGAQASAAPRKAGRFVFGLALAALSALLVTLAFPPFGVWWLIFVAWVPMLIAQHHVLPRRWSGLAIGIGIGGYAAGYLIGVLQQPGGGAFAWWMFCIPLAAGLLAGFGSIRDRPIQEATGYVRFVIGFPLLWAAAEFLRGLAPGIGTQGYLAYALYREPWLLQPVSVFGVSMLNLLILVVNWTIGLGVLVALQRRLSSEPRLISSRVMTVSALGTAAAVLLWVVASLLMFQPDPPTVKVAAIQSGLNSQGAAEFHRDAVQTELAARSGARLVVWREKGLIGDLPHDALGRQVSGLARRAHVYLVVGYQYETSRGMANDAAMISPKGQYLGVYGKEHPALMFADDQTSADAGFMPVYTTPFGRVATIICFDADYTDTARSAAQHGAQLLAVPTWNPPGDATKHYNLLVFRAIENRLTIVESDSAYASTIIDPYGRILDSVVTPQGTQATLIDSVPVGSGQTVLVTLGNLWGWLIVVGAIGIIAIGTRRPFKSPTTEDQLASR